MYINREKEKYIESIFTKNVSPKWIFKFPKLKIVCSDR